VKSTDARVINFAKYAPWDFFLCFEGEQKEHQSVLFVWKKLNCFFKSLVIP